MYELKSRFEAASGGSSGQIEYSALCHLLDQHGDIVILVTALVLIAAVAVWVTRIK